MLHRMADNPDLVFLETLKEGLSSVHEEVLDLGAAMRSTSPAIATWATDRAWRRGKRGHKSRNREDMG